MTEENWPMRITKGIGDRADQHKSEFFTARAGQISREYVECNCLGANSEMRRVWVTGMECSAETG